ncbi:MAG: hypothetical protein QNJ33_12555 [Crocosphaera sp.]|nr:hypothetical protein [Crocosphaera sp.]
MLLNYNPNHCLPSAEDLPDSDDKPVDNQLQHLIPHLLLDILALIWAERQDWYFGVDEESSLMQSLIAVRQGVTPPEPPT